jgi:hypothetical protein
MDTTMKNLLEKHKDMRAIDFYEKLEPGILLSFPIDDAALCAFDIKVGDLLEYMHPGQERLHWSDILKTVLQKKGIL